MAYPQRGQIVTARVTDPNGQNPKIRPLVIVSATANISPGQPFLAVAITGTLAKPLPPDCVELPWAPQGKCVTGLNKRNVAVCSWLEKITVEDIESYRGVVPPKQLLKILEFVKVIGAQS